MNEWMNEWMNESFIDESMYLTIDYVIRDTQLKSIAND